MRRAYLAVVVVMALLTFSLLTMSPLASLPSSATTPAPTSAAVSQTQSSVQAAACSGSVIGYVAPTLVRVVKDAARGAGLSVEGIQSVGSLEGLRRIQQGSVPDVYASVDIELAADVKDARQIYSLGRFKLALACAKPIASVGDLRGVKMALADPNKAPIGYRELAAVYMLKRSGVADLTARYEALGIRFVDTAVGFNVTVPTALFSTAEVKVAPSLDGSWSMLETGQVDCVFAHLPFILGKGVELKPVGASAELWEVYVGNYSRGRLYVYVFKSPYDFFQDPPLAIYANLVDPSGRVVKAIRVVHFEAFVVSFTERGDCVVEALKKMDLANYGFVK